MRTRWVAGGILAGALVLLQLAPSSEPEYSPWSAPVNLGPVVNSSYADMQPVVSKDGLSLYFASNSPGGLGGYDLWVSQRGSEDAGWGTPVPLGRPQQGADTWVSTRRTVYDPWTPPELVEGLNSAASDGQVSLSSNGMLLYITSDRVGSIKPSPGLERCSVPYARPSRG